MVQAVNDTTTVTIPLTEAEYIAAVDQLGDMREAALQALREALAVFADEVVREIAGGQATGKPVGIVKP